MSIFSLGNPGTSRIHSNSFNEHSSYNDYQLGLNNSGNLTSSLTGLSADANLQLLNSNRAVFRSSSANLTNAEAISIDKLAAGTSSARIQQVSGYNNYALSLTTDEAGNTLNTARTITVNSTTTTYSDFVGTTDTNDYYRFSLNSRSTLNLLLDGLSADADLQLLDSNGAAIDKSFNGGTTAESIGSALEAGMELGCGHDNWELPIMILPMA